MHLHKFLPKKAQVGKFLKSLLPYSVLFLTGHTVGPLCAAQPESAWGVNNCIVLACYPCCSSPACLVCPSERQMTHTHTHRAASRGMFLDAVLSNNQALVKALGKATVAALFLSPPHESHFVWLALPWWGGIFWEYEDGLFLKAVLETALHWIYWMLCVFTIQLLLRQTGHPTTFTELMYSLARCIIKTISQLIYEWIIGIIKYVRKHHVGFSFSFCLCHKLSIFWL